MQSSAWMALFRAAPPEQHNNLLVTMANGTEVAIAFLVRMEKDYVVVRGRLTGTTDNASYFFLPYDQISVLGFQRQVTEGEIQAMLSSPAPAEAPESPPASPVREPLPASPVPVAAVAAPAPQAVPVPRLKGPTAPVQPGNESMVRSIKAAKIALLERLRNRRADNGNPPVSP